MKILIIPEYGSRGSGTLIYLAKLLEIHKRNQIETAVLVEKKQLIPEAKVVFEQAGIKIFVSPNRHRIFFLPGLSIIFDICFCRRALRSFKPELIHVSAGTPGLLLGALFYRLPLLFTMHTYPVKKMWVCKLLFSYWINHSAKVLFATVSKYSAANINKYMDIESGIIEVVYNSCRQSENNDKARNFIILTVGHVVEYKNPECWFEVAKKVLSIRPDVKFIWLGAGDLLARMRERVREAGLGSQIILNGYCDHVESYYDKAMVYFHPSKIESHGLTVIEAMSHGLPCVTSNVGGLPESVVDGETGFTCSPENVDLFEARILELLNIPTLRDRMGAFGKNRAEYLFPEAIQEEKIVALYRSMLLKRKD